MSIKELLVIIKIVFDFEMTNLRLFPCREGVFSVAKISFLSGREVQIAKIITTQNIYKFNLKID